jgi:hypothetical protein
MVLQVTYQKGNIALMRRIHHTQPDDDEGNDVRARPLTHPTRRCSPHLDCRRAVRADRHALESVASFTAAALRPRWARRARAVQDAFRSGMGTHMGSAAPPSMYPGYYSGMAPSMGGPGSHYAASHYAGPGSQYASPGSQYAGPGSHYQGSQISPSMVQMPSPYYSQQ